MIAIYAFALTWISLAVGILLFALIKGRKPKTGPNSPSANRRLVVIFGLVILGLGIAIPAASIADSHDSKVVRGTGVALTPDQKHGQALFGQLCGGCHRLASANAVGRVGPNLDVQLAPQPTSTAAEARKSYLGRQDYVYTTIINGLQRGNGNMPALVTQGKQAKEIASFVAATAGYSNYQPNS
jgi:mono/diheme cytochrome c family protein